jgi:adenylate cyclase
MLCADVFGYSRLMGEDEEATLRTLSSHRKLVDSLIEQHHGRFVNSAGDSVLAEFASVVNAVQCAVEIQTTLKSENANIPPERRMEFRIGVNLGDVIVDGEQIYGDGVNVAARLESLADPGGICISDTVHAQIKNKLGLTYEDLGAQSVKNIAEPIRVYRVMMEGGTTTRTTTKATQQPLRKHWRGGVFSLAGLALIIAVIVLVQHLSLRPPTTTASIPPTQSPALPLPNIPSIAVLPFINMSGDREQEYFSDGITNDLITALSKGPDIFVIDRASTFTYKSKPVRVQDVSRELGVKYVLEGGVQKAGEKVRISVQLVDATTGADLWAEHYDRPMKDIFWLQDEIVRRIVTTLDLQLALWEKHGVLVRKSTDNLEAYDDVLRGIEYSFSSTKQGNERAREMYEKAIELDPKYAGAYAQLAWTYYSDWILQWSPDPHALDRVFDLAQQAVALDDSRPMGYILLNRVALYKRQYEQAISQIQRAIALDQNNAFAYFWLANTLALSGRPEDAIRVAEKAMRLDPRNRDSYLFLIGLAYTEMGKYADAVPAFTKNVARYPNNGTAHGLLIVDYTELGRDKEARAEAAEFIRISPQYSMEVFEKRTPFKDRPFRDRVLADMRKAGLK